MPNPPHRPERRKRKRVRLFSRITITLTIPLLVLILVFTAIQLANAMRVLNESYQLKSRFAFESIQRTLSRAIQGQDEMDLEAISRLVNQLTNAHEGISIALFSLIDKRVLFPQDAYWSSFDANALEESLYQKQRGQPTLVRIKRDAKQLNAYMPFKNRDDMITVVARVEVPLADIREALSHSQWTLLLMIAFITLTGITIGYKLSNSILRPIRVLNEATQEIVKGRLGKHANIETGDEIEDLARTFNRMSDSLQEMQKKAIDANPLTGLPGNQGIFQELKRRIYERQKFVLFHTDLDRFKVFNDHFGLGKGDEAIKRTAELLVEAREKAGSKNDFIGHQGGDDFVVVTKPATAVKLAEYITRTFDQEVVRMLYPKEDFERGYTLQMDRRKLAETGEETMAEFPLLALSLAGVSSVKKDFADYFDCMSAAVSVKKEVKQEIKSSYLIKE